MTSRCQPYRQRCSEVAGMLRALKVVGISLLSTLFVTGCLQLGPDYVEPDTPVETDWLEIDNQYVSTEPPAGPRWWESAFKDPELDSLVSTALLQNLSLRSAGLRA